MDEKYGTAQDDSCALAESYDWMVSGRYQVGPDQSDSIPRLDGKKAAFLQHGIGIDKKLKLRKAEG